MEGWNSPTRSTAPELNGSDGADPSGWGAALGSGEALGPAYRERGGVRWLGTDGAAENRGGCGGDSLSEGGSSRGVDKQMGGSSFIAAHYMGATRACARRERGI
jgi:hypothetical protein